MSSINDTLARCRRLRENIILGKEMLFDSGKYVGLIPKGKEHEFDQMWLKLLKWIDEYEELTGQLVDKGVDLSEFFCGKCRSKLAIIWTESQLCCTCQNSSSAVAQFKKHGWFEVESTVLGGETIVIVRDETVKVPASHSKMIQYSSADIEYMKSFSKQAIRCLHAVMKFYGGTLSILEDPRPDLIDDHRWWERLLAGSKNSPVHAALYGFRCQGARLSADVLGIWHIEYDSSREGFDGQEDFDHQYDQWIRQSEAELVALLQSMEPRR